MGYSATQPNLSRTCQADYYATTLALLNTGPHTKVLLDISQPIAVPQIVMSYISAKVLRTCVSGMLSLPCTSGQ